MGFAGKEPWLINVENLTKRYGNRPAVQGLSFKVRDGEILGFLGPNGAGKSTTMNIITGYLSSAEGSVKVNGHDILENPEDTKRQIGYMPEVPPLYPEMTVREYLQFAAALKGLPRHRRDPEIRRTMDLVHIGDVTNRLIKNLSKGYRQRVGFAQAMLADPPILILDEPTIGLDPQQINEFRTLLKSMGGNHTIILSSHILSEVSAICERVLIFNRGRIVASDTPENLVRGISDRNSMLLRVRGKESEVRKAVEGCPGIRGITFQESVESGTVDFSAEGRKDSDIREGLFRALSKAGLPILLMKPADSTLEEAFLSITADYKELK
jgi:ABC-2 type transport system ATP-binding protein